MSDAAHPSQSSNAPMYSLQPPRDFEMKEAPKTEAVQRKSSPSTDVRRLRATLNETNDEVASSHQTNNKLKDVVGQMEASIAKQKREHAARMQSLQAEIERLLQAGRDQQQQHDHAFRVYTEDVREYAATSAALRAEVIQINEENAEIRRNLQSVFQAHRIFLDMIVDPAPN